MLCEENELMIFYLSEPLIVFRSSLMCKTFNGNRMHVIGPECHNT